MPNRILKESIRTSKNVNNLTDFQFRVWVYLITYVDDYGRGSADPELLKGLVFTRRKGVTEGQIEKALADLANIGMINLYEADGESFFYFPNWQNHQRIQTKKSKFPSPPLSTAGHGGTPPEYNPIRIQNPNTESEYVSENTTCSQDTELGRVMNAYVDRLGSFFSSEAADALKQYLEAMGEDVLMHALTIAVDAKKVSWQYIRGILRNYAQNQVKCLDDAIELETAFERGKEQAAALKQARSNRAAVIGKNANAIDIGALKKTLGKI